MVDALEPPRFRRKIVGKLKMDINKAKKNRVFSCKYYQAVFEDLYEVGTSISIE